MQTRQAKILCVDDESHILQALDRLFKSDFHVLLAESATSALEALETHPDVAVVLSDYRMPDMSGVDFLRQVRHLYPQTSRAILSGQMDLQRVSEALNARDIHKFFLKPWENDYLKLQMLEAVQTHWTLVEKAHFEHLSITDPITQLSNHRHFQDQLKQLMAQSRANLTPLSLAIFDVDHFKSFNDRFGHPEGDRLLFSVASHLKQKAGTLGLVSRYGGEEFTLILPNHSGPEALKVCEDIRQTFEKIHFSGLTSKQVYITVSVGISEAPLSPTNPPTESGTLVEAADRALYQAKRQGRNQCVLS